MSERRDDRLLETIVDQCLDEIVAGHLSVDEALMQWPEHRDQLAPLFDVALAMRELPSIPEHAPDPDRRAAFMGSIAATPQQRPRRGLGTTIGGWLAGISSATPRIAAIATPAAAIALVAVFVLLSSGADRASASTLTVFDGAVERLDDGVWLPISDGDSLNEGERLRTSVSGVALLTFPDGSTAALDPLTEIVLELIAIDGSRNITLEQIEGRIWNDVAPGQTSATYMVRTPDAVVEAHGTTFETIVRDGTTSVVTASGLVEVAAGDERAMVQPGLILHASDQQIVDSLPHPSTDVPATLRVDGPFVASLQAENGAATGALPTGVTYQQIPGLSTTDPGDGAQVMQFYDVAPGRYTLVLRRIDAPLIPGLAILDANGRQRSIDLPPDLETLRIQIDVGLNGSVVSLALVDRESTSIEPPVRDERIVDTPRSTDAVAVSDRRADQATPAPTEARPTATVGTDRPPPTATDAEPSASPVPPRDRLLAILDLPSSDRATELRRFLEAFGDDESRWQLLRERLEADGDLRQRFAETLTATRAPAFIETVRAYLGLADSPPDRDETPAATATPGSSDRPDGATATPTAADGAARDGP